MMLMISKTMITEESEEGITKKMTSNYATNF
jgi:hypothetical protein